MFTVNDWLFLNFSDIMVSVLNCNNITYLHRLYVNYYQPSPSHISSVKFSELNWSSSCAAVTWGQECFKSHVTAAVQGSKCQCHQSQRLSRGVCSPLGSSATLSRNLQPCCCYCGISVTFFHFFFSFCCAFSSVRFTLELACITLNGLLLLKLNWLCRVCPQWDLKGCQLVWVQWKLKGWNSLLQTSSSVKKIMNCPYGALII